MEQPTHRDFLIHLNQGNFQAAVDLANELKLDKDLIYKTQWTKRKEERGPQLQLADIELLKLVTDDVWVAGQCLDVCLDEPDAQKELLTLGHSRIYTLTEPILKQLETTTQLSAKERTFLRTHLYFLQYSDRLQTFTKIWPSLSHANSFANEFAQFRDCNLIAQAIEFARSENNVALDAIFMHHGQTVLPYRLFILSQIPETVDPSRFDLPHVTHDHEDKWLEESWRTHQDIVEQDWVQRMIELDVQEQIDYLSRLKAGIEATEYPSSAHVIADWYLERARAADKIGLCSTALEICRYAQVMGITEIESITVDYEWLCKYVYASTSVTNDDEENYVDLEKFRELSSYDVLEGLLRNTNASTILDDMTRLALPWIEVSKRKIKEDDEEEEKGEILLYRWLLAPTIVNNHLDWLCSIFEMSKPTIPVEDRIIKDDLDLSRLILAIVYSSGELMDYLIRLFECLPIFEQVDDDEPLVEMAQIFPKADSPFNLFLELQSIGSYGLTRMMDTLQNHLGSAEVLARYHASVPLRWFLEDQSLEAQRHLCIRMASRASGGVESGGVQFDRDDDWRELLDDMLRLCDHGQGIFGKLDSTEIIEIFFSTLLRCGRFRLAKELILGSRRIIDVTKAERLVIDAEREFFDNATSGNKHSGSMKQAWECLSILPPTTEIKKEMALIEATHTLISEYKTQDRPGMILMPIQIRQSKNRLELISKLIHTKQDIYLRHEKVLELVQQLGLVDVLAKVKTLSLLASAALVEEDYLESYKLCQLAVDAARSKPAANSKSYNDEVNQTAWQICLSLGKVDAFNDTSRRLDVLSMAMTLSPVENIRDVLAIWRKLDQQKPSQIALAQLGTIHHENPEAKKGWQGLLQNATKQWNLTDLLTRGGEQESSETHNKRKRDIIRDAVGGWLFQ
ncbi:secretory pathway protein Sec39-domain-containing protein [Cokeromyces recurvatus]|uniref:secretory pathway protein Sec39-domain-containing protein n=1 Tax=Cokeromyces recurvatus TaxID=90255 RepID=UPI00221F190F|nr:secretory pathway protein Sec39-domain-containing protein [Cokeromyces recurvatus]KAI7899664.1 secretory pathway protein Sec39-domain-containing protein [Cokeromyces recurvatus]